MRALIVTNMQPSPGDPARGVFVYDQIDALRRIDGVEVDVFSFPHGMSNYPRAAAALRRRHRRDHYDVIHAHFGLTAWPSLALRGAPHVVTLHGNDLIHPRSRRISAAAFRYLDLVAVVSSSLARLLPETHDARCIAVLPCGVAMDRFKPMDRAAARAELGLDPDGRYVLFTANPERTIKRVDRARAVVAGEAELLTLGHVAPAKVPLWVNAANAMIVPSDDEGFGLAVPEALACDVPVLATPVGIHPVALDGIAGAFCEQYDEGRWRAALAACLSTPGCRVQGRARAELFSADRMARRVVAAWKDLIGALDSPQAPDEGAVSL